MSVRGNSPGSFDRSRDSGTGAVIAGVLGLAVVIAVGGFFYSSVSPAPMPPMAVSAPATAVVVDSPVAAAPSSGEVIAAASTKPAAENEKAPAAKPASTTVAERVSAHLEAGEFAAALELAIAATDDASQNDLIARVADAQRKAGDFDAAAATLRLIGDRTVRVRESGEAAAETSLAGGGSLADFQPLIDLIQNETSGPWQDIQGDGGTISSFDTGVRVDPNGLFAMLSREERDGRLKEMGVRARAADLNDDVARASALRFVSLTRLEREVSKRLAAGQPVLETMRQLAGLSQIQYVILDKESGEVLLGGPAEGWRYDENGLPVGATSGRPTLQLDMYQCLIVPRQEGLKSVREFVEASNARGPLSAGAGVKNWTNQIQQKLGQQDVEINGIALDSRVARVILEADYRMKLIGIGKLDAGKDIPSYFDLIPPAEQAGNSNLDALRWWLTMKYDALLHSPDRSVFEVQGSSVKCLSENEFINQDGSRVHTGKADATNRLFAERFTAKYAELAERDSVFADLQNLMDLSLAAALLSHEQKEHGLDWNAGAFARSGQFQPARFAPAKTVMSAVNHRVYGGKNIVVQVAGGVRADLMTVVTDKKIVREQPRLQSVAATAKAPAQIPEGRWWWDAAR